MKKRMKWLRLLMLVCGIAGTSVLAGCSGKDQPYGSQAEIGAEQDEAENDTAKSGDGMLSDSAEYTNPDSSDSQSGITVQWQEVTFRLPADWEGKYILIEENDVISVYQRASYEKEEGMGFLFSVVKSGDWMNYGAGEQMIAYTDEGMMYYLMQPTDVTCFAEDEAIVTEHGAMSSDINQIVTAVEIDVENIHYDADQFVIPVSSVMTLTQDMLLNYTDNELWVARNEIYARHGRVFQNEYLQGLFDSCSWYQKDENAADIPESELSEIELANLKVIVAAEEAYRKEHPYPQECRMGEVIRIDLQGNGKENSVSYQVSAKGEYEYSCMLTIDGVNYDLEEYITMITPVEDVFYITNLNDPIGGGEEDGLEIAVLDEGPSYDPITHFFKYDGELAYIGNISGFPFREQNGRMNGFNNYSGVTGMLRGDLLETAYFDGYWWYDSQAGTLEFMDSGWHNYQSYRAHTLYVDLPVYLDETAEASVVIPAGSQVYFMESDREEWIYLRSKEGTSGLIQIKDNEVLNVGLPGEEVFSDLYYFD